MAGEALPSGTDTTFAVWKFLNRFRSGLDVQRPLSKIGDKRIIDHKPCSTYPLLGHPAWPHTWQSLRLNSFTCKWKTSVQAMELLLLWKQQIKSGCYASTHSPAGYPLRIKYLSLFIIIFIVFLHPYALCSAVLDIVKIAKKKTILFMIARFICCYGAATGFSWNWLLCM